MAEEPGGVCEVNEYVILANEKELRGSDGSDLFLEAVNEFYCRDFKTFNPLHEGKKQTF